MGGGGGEGAGREREELTGALTVNNHISTADQVFLPKSDSISPTSQSCYVELDAVKVHL